MSGNEQASTVYVMKRPEWVKVGISDNLPLRAGDLKATVVETYAVGQDARLVESIACKLLSEHLCGGYEYFACSPSRAVSAVEAAIVMAWRGDFSVFRYILQVPGRYRQRLRMARPHYLHKRRAYDENEHVFEYWRHRQNCSIQEALAGVERQYGIVINKD